MLGQAGFFSTEKNPAMGYERIVRNAREMDAIWRSIEANPANWAQDNENIHP